MSTNHFKHSALNAEYWKERYERACAMYKHLKKQLEEEHMCYMCTHAKCDRCMPFLEENEWDDDKERP